MKSMTAKILPQTPVQVQMITVAHCCLPAAFLEQLVHSHVRQQNPPACMVMPCVMTWYRRKHVFLDTMVSVL